jgi:hypothetical protein
MQENTFLSLSYSCVIFPWVASWFVEWNDENLKNAISKLLTTIVTTLWF